MNTDLNNHLSACRFCLKSFKSSRKKTRITEEIKEMFFELVQVQLNLSAHFSSNICDFCNKQLKDANKIRKNFSENQERLYQFVLEKEGMSQEFYIDTEEQRNAGDFVSDSFNTFNVKTEVIVVKTEDFEINQGYDIESTELHEDTEIASTALQKSETLPANENSVNFETEIEETKLNCPKGYKLCPICGKMLRDDPFRVHMKAHQNLLDNIFYFCDNCDYKTHRKKQLTAHMYKHRSDESKKVFQCSLCPQSFFRMNLLKYHVKNTHETPKTAQDPIKCEICNRIFKTLKNFTLHQNTIHQVLKYPCEECDQVFMSAIIRQTHFDTFHAPKSPCDICGKMVGPGNALRAHKYTHDRVQCHFEGCGKFFNRKRNLMKHISGVHTIQQGVTCPICNAEYKNDFKLRKHIQLQHRAEKKPCRVAGCNHVSPRTAYLVLHIKNHKDIDGAEKERIIREIQAERDEKINRTF